MKLKNLAGNNIVQENAKTKLRWQELRKYAEILIVIKEYHGYWTNLKNLNQVAFFVLLVVLRFLIICQGERLKPAQFVAENFMVNENIVQSYVALNW